jgi:putative IMPACT (imprinted ancient) family translation regulator
VSDEVADRTIARPTRSQFTVRGSRFVGRAAPVGDVDAAEGFLERVRADHIDATHHVPAYRVRADPFREYAADDGEPSGSAGDPVLSMRSGRELENVAVVVVRYDGGTELGVGGLVRAYSPAATDALDAGAVDERRPRTAVTVTVADDDSGTVRGILESEGVEFDAADEAEGTVDVSVPVAHADRLVDRVRSATGGRATVE